MDDILFIILFVVTALAFSVLIFLIRQKGSFNRSAKNTLIVLTSVVIVLSGLFSANLFLIKSNDGQISQDELTYVKNDFKLSHISDISVSEYPNMYDFVGGSIGANNKDIDIVSDGVYAFVTKEGSSKFYVSRKGFYEGASSIKEYLPQFSSKPMELLFDSEERFDGFNKHLKNDENVIRVSEGDYTFYYVSSSPIDATTNYHGFDVSWFDNNVEPGDMDNFVSKNGNGYPTNLVRSSCDVSKIKEAYGVDFNDEFWNSINYGARIKCFNNDDKVIYCVLEPSSVNLVAGLGDKVNTFSINGLTLNTDKDGINTILREKGYQTVDEAISGGVFASKTEAEALYGKNI